MKLTEKQEHRAIELFVSGNSRSEVVRVFIETDSAIKKQAEASGDLSSFRKHLSDKLRSCDPMSGRFAFKHESHFVSCVNRRVDNVSLQYDIERVDRIDVLRDQLNQIDADIEALSEKIETETDTPIYLQLIKVRDALRKRRVESHDRLIDRLERLYFASKRFEMQVIDDELKQQVQTQAEVDSLFGRGS